MRRLPLRSPPRVRGKVVAFFVYIQLGGITPAYAGKRGLSTTTGRGWKDHPRVCGEKKAELTPDELSRGSPPRMRGNVHVSPGQVGGVGITPAYAGKSVHFLSGHSFFWDHPRVCGEKPTQTAPTPASPISSMARWVTRVPGPSSSTEMPAAGI